MAITPKLSATFVEASQAQKHLTINSFMLLADAVVQASVKSVKLLNSPPTTPVPINGDTYIIGTLPTGVWSGFPSYLTAYQDNVWKLYKPSIGWLVYNTTTLSYWYCVAGATAETIDWVILPVIPLNSGTVRDAVIITASTTLDVFGSGLKTYIISPQNNAPVNLKLPTAILNKGIYRIKINDTSPISVNVGCVVTTQTINNVSGATGITATAGSYYDFASDNTKWLRIS
jgi:hypothetical protein